MEELNLVLDTVVRTYNEFLPFLEELHLIEIGLGALFVVGGLRLILPIFGGGLDVLRKER
jgi:hypothetical protein